MAENRPWHIQQAKCMAASSLPISTSERITWCDLPCVYMCRLCAQWEASARCVFSGLTEISDAFCNAGRLMNSRLKYEFLEGLPKQLQASSVEIAGTEMMSHWCDWFSGGKGFNVNYELTLNFCCCLPFKNKMSSKYSFQEYSALTLSMGLLV